ncbi:phage tail length tape measure family protein [Pseudomonas aeruginosa]|uniref:phage tail length tape measure family protein n=1 Tax=Pseudomonas aeruginosa TaxID=287 RepID=UPI000EB5F25A|nr:phage tail length tape measure family protein [Pseudomonas aeruginosa]MBH3798425.1 phage tail length tape measure family protein [Pseudomonas aeruginosa]MBH9095475.1 phage tail length tape measure family protein [Pseudomonas aeruginosa]MBI8444828.1 phage tail length tape measure family protein [Pseudomonas aeruginosa]MBX6570697.1 phage tail length tape measure family protein [Pseudomonas aeruginosa]MBX6806187.1 phage tail length tape measure family protein [Pseudomonas aeruginosa]
MATGKELDLALRIRADGNQGAQALDNINSQVEQIGTSATATSSQLSAIGESADQQAARLKAMVAASLQQQAAFDALASSSDKLNTSTRAATAGWQESARAQSASMNAYHNAERARQQQIATEQRAAEAAAKASAEFDKQQAELAKLLGAIDPVTRELEKLDNLERRLGQARSARLIDPEGFTTYNAKLQEQRERLLGTSDAMAVAGISAGQYRQAMRQLPAQITDVVTSLASGMPIWLVAIQQGGQIKDSFGGVGATFQALGDKIKSFFGVASTASEGLGEIARGADAAAVSANNARTAMTGLSGAGSAFAIVGVAAAAAGVALAAAYEKGRSEATELNKAIILTGNYAGTSAGQLSAMAAAIAKANGTQYEAVAVLSEITATGKFTVDQIELVASTAIAMQDATGKAVSETVAEFSKLAEDPVRASQQLNEKYHYLTASVYEQITALNQQGDTLGAAQLAMDAYGQAMDERASQIVENLGTMERAWKTVAGVAKGAWDEMLGVGRTETPEERLEQLTKGQAFQPGRAVASGAVFGPLGWFNELRKAYQRSSMSDDERGKQFTDALQEIQDEGEKAQKARLDRYLEDEAIRGQQSMDKLLESVRTNKEKRDKLNRELDRSIAAIQATNPEDERLRPENIAAARRAIDEKYKDPKTPKGPSTPLDQSTVTEAKNQLDQLQADYRNAEQSLQAQQRAGLLSYADYVARRSELIRQNKDQVTAAYQAEIQALEALRSKSTTTAAQRISLDQKIADARNNMVKAQKKSDADLEILQVNEQGRLKKQAQAVKAYADALQQQQDALALQGERAAAAVGMGAQQRRLFEQRGNLDDRFTQQRLDLASQYGDGSRGMSLDEYNDKLQKLQANHAAMTEQLQRNYAALQVAQADWTNGARSAFADYLDSARNVAGQTYDLFSNAMSGLENSVVSAVTTGKASLDDFLRTLAADSARMATRQLGASLLSSFGLGETKDAGSKDLAVGASAVSASAGALATAGGTLVTGAAAIQAAAASLAAANGGQVVSGAASAAGQTGPAAAIAAASTEGAAAMGSAISEATTSGGGTLASALAGVFGQGASLFGNLFSSLFGGGAAGGTGGGGGWLQLGMSAASAYFGGGFADGGRIQGPGTGTSDSIPILASNDEFMTRAAVVRQPGALAFLEQFNRYGMAALGAWANPVRHATGGLMGTPAPAMPAPGLAASRLQEPAKNLSATLKNNQNFYLVDDPSRIGDVMAGRYGDEAMVLHISRDPQKFRQLLGIN